MIELDRCTLFYFISDAKGHCERARVVTLVTQRLLVNVSCEKYIVEALALVPALVPKSDEQLAHNGALGLMRLGFAMEIIGLVGILVNMIGVHFEDDHVAPGFGNHFARPIREEWRKDLSFEDGVKILEKCMRVLLYRDRSAVNKLQLSV
ncbi:Proteasome, subunit alpha/beta [Parasponia andersonii]|uniref:Proteasome, subunit alpha/beta n=1 Tax=Parasponia andersonii TaxID=3476 RepID=A0A2P5AZJ8_PARAD|nr:Proteasome, subunit alpha/beta [Parasponia andersonii]